MHLESATRAPLPKINGGAVRKVNSGASTIIPATLAFYRFWKGEERKKKRLMASVALALQLCTYSEWFYMIPAFKKTTTKRQVGLRPYLDHQVLPPSTMIFYLEVSHAVRIIVSFLSFLFLPLPFSTSLSLNPRTTATPSNIHSLIQLFQNKIKTNHLEE